MSLLLTDGDEKPAAGGFFANIGRRQGGFSGERSKLTFHTDSSAWGLCGHGIVPQADAWG